MDELARDVGRLRHHVDSDSYGGMLLSRIADRVETIDLIISPTAHELYIDRLVLGVPEDDAVADALACVDARTRTLQTLLRGEPAGRLRVAA